MNTSDVQITTNVVEITTKDVQINTKPSEIRTLVTTLAQLQGDDLARHPPSLYPVLGTPTASLLRSGSPTTPSCPAGWFYASPLVLGLGYPSPPPWTGNSSSNFDLFTFKWRETATRTFISRPLSVIIQYETDVRSPMLLLGVEWIEKIGLGII